MLSVFRKELKYVMYAHEFAALRPSLEALLYRDNHGGDFGYPVRSLYFDSYNDRDYYDAVDGLLEKSKIRLRTYGPGSTIKLEQKQKQGSDSLKHSLIVSPQEARLLQQGDYRFLLNRPEPEAMGICLQLMQGAYQPKTLVEYNREAFTFPAGDVRITFDSDARATASGWDLLDPRPPFTPIIPPGTGVLEVKYTGILPGFVKGLIETGRMSAANSKYVQARQFYQIGGDLK